MVLRIVVLCHLEHKDVFDAIGEVRSMLSEGESL